MEPENVELVRAIYRGWERGDFSSAEWAHAELEYVPARGALGQGAGRGHGAMASSWREWLSVWDDFSVAATEYIELGDRVLVLSRLRGRGRGSGVALDQPAASLFTIHDGKVVRLALYTDPRQALEDTGLA